jgi:hypothetical protein
MCSFAQNRNQLLFKNIVTVCWIDFDKALVVPYAILKDLDGKNIIYKINFL